ncbi:MAG: cellulose biosynthesis cyclic di-GMP-binding regulatory protein BcsB [Chitinophagaceae bacterium]|nr:cellulose biosynthesis cyclic di-GMP-binding regulatory protein BcsB [Chitinophagaceae bacterium]
MKSRILLSALFMLAISCAWSQTVQRTFEEMGYRDQSIFGISGAITYFVKVKPDDNMDDSKLVLYIRPSQVLNPNTSTVTISLKDAPIYTQKIIASSIDSLITIIIPMNKKYLQPDGRFVKVKIVVKMSVADLICQDIDNPACWINIRNSSFFSSSKQSVLSYERSMKETIQEFSSIASPANPDLNDVLAGGMLYSMVKQLNKETITTTKSYGSGDSLNRTLVVGLASRLPESIKRQLPTINKGEGLIMVLGNEGNQVMVVTAADDEGYKKVITVLSNFNILNSAFSKKLIVDNATVKKVESTILPQVLTLEQLGVPSALMEGVLALQTNYPFNLIDYNAIPKKLTLHLEALFSHLRENDRGFLNVYLNDNLVFTTSLLDMNSFNNEVDLPTYLLTKVNSLVIEMRFHPSQSVCKDGFASFFGFINSKTSSITFSGEQPTEFYNFFNYPGEFRKRPLKFLISPGLNPSITSAVGELISQINAASLLNSSMMLPQLVQSDKTTMADMRGYNVIALMHRTDPFVKNFTSMPIQFNRDFQLYKDLDGETSFSFNDFSGSGIAQIFRQSNSTFLLISSLGDSTTKEALQSVIKSFGGQASAIQSNVCISTSDGKSNFFFKLRDDERVITYKGDKNLLLQFWESYKYFILIVILLLIVWSFFFVRRRVKKSQEIV